jgi:hypothetical protein
MIILCTPKAPAIRLLGKLCFTMKMKIAEIFNEQPSQWGLRGDPLLWLEMKDAFSETDMPETPEALKIILEQKFKELTGHSTAHKKPIVINRFKTGGMSSGGISTEFWEQQGLPLLVSRHVKT